MVNIWKIGAWPGWPGIEKTPRNKQRFIDFALKNNVVAIGFSRCNVEKCKSRSGKYCKGCRQSNEFLNFSENIRFGDIILLYNHFKVYIGKVSKTHYKVQQSPRHRIDVEWLSKKPKKANFGMWQDTVHPVYKKDLVNVMDKELKLFLEHEITIKSKLNLKQNNKKTTRRKYGSSGEGKDHKKLKNWIADNPKFVGLENVVITEIDNHIFPSGDRPDIVFFCEDNNYATVEIETNQLDGGMYQAIKYKSLLCAELGLPLNSPNVKTFLIAWEMPKEVKDFCDKYEVVYKKKKLNYK